MSTRLHLPKQMYLTKKHVLVCSEHSRDQSNKDLLSTYKQCCVRSPNLPDFSRNINLSTHADESFKTTHTSGDTESTGERGIYMLQTISIDNNAYTIFFDTGCSDFASNLQQSNHLVQQLQCYHPRLQKSVELVKHHLNPFVPTTSKFQSMMVVQHLSME